MSNFKKAGGFVGVFFASMRCAFVQSIASCVSLRYKGFVRLQIMLWGGHRICGTS